MEIIKTTKTQRFLISFVSLCLCGFFLPAITVNASAQITKTKGSINGRVTIGGKGEAGVILQLFPSGQTPDSSRPVAEATTDQDGRFQITGLEGAGYKIIPLAPELFIQNEDVAEQPGKAVTIGDGENLKDLDIKLARGAVITGKVVDGDGEPIIRGSVTVNTIGKFGSLNAYLPTSFTAETDDRGLYRIYGLPAGQYVVGAKVTVAGNSDKNREAFYPNATIQSEATALEIEGGTETTNINILFSIPEPPTRTYKVTGRIVSSFDGSPAGNVQYNYYDINEERVVNLGVGDRLFTNFNGEFQLKGLMPGRYAIYVSPDLSNSIFGETVNFEIIDSNVTGLEVKLYPGASISGTVVIKGTTDPEVIEKVKTQNFFVTAQTQETDKPFRKVSNQKRTAVSLYQAFRRARCRSLHKPIQGGASVSVASSSVRAR
jgi:hypothetical protein